MIAAYLACAVMGAFSGAVFGLGDPSVFSVSLLLFVHVTAYLAGNRGLRRLGTGRYVLTNVNALVHQVLAWSLITGQAHGIVLCTLVSCGLFAYAMWVQRRLGATAHARGPPVEPPVEPSAVTLDAVFLEAPELDCSICLERMTRGDESAPLKAVSSCEGGHVFHEACLAEWVAMRPARACPLCGI